MSEITEAIKDVALLQPKRGDIAVFRLNRPLTGAEQAEFREIATTVLAPHVEYYIVLGPDADLELLSAEDMRKAGWVRES